MRLLAAVLVLFASIPAGADEPTGKLPTGVAPTHYALSLKIDPRAARFSGTARIRIKLDQASDHLWLHGKKLALTNSTLTDAAGKRRKLTTITHAESGLIEVRFGATLPAQEAELSIDYSAPFNPESEGLFVVKVGKESYAVTQMEAITARYVFPGFDEPRFKTPFDIVLTVPSTDTAFANTQAVGEAASADGRWKTVTYATTKPLPTYLIALAVGPWDVVAGPTLAPGSGRDHPLPLRVMGPRGTGPQLHWIVEQMAGVVEYFERYTGQPYAFDKLDLLGVPGFSATAMENAGLIIFDDVLLRLDTHSPASAYVEAFVVAAHEVSHQWFGDLVTMRWWDDLWLNESFANWAQARVTIALKPDYLGELARVGDGLDAMNSDSLLSARQIRQPINNDGDIDNAFDDITYLKGAALLRMIEAWLGEDTYRDALREYLAGRTFGSGSTDDLIATLEKASGNHEVGGVMHSFLDQPGVPLIHGELGCRDGKPALALNQTRYLPYGAAPKGDPVWHVPVCARFWRDDGSSAKQCFLLTQPKQEFAVAGKCADWYVLNAGADGYYRVAMAPNDLTLRAHFAALAPTEQAGYAEAIASGFRHGDFAPSALLAGMPALADSAYPQIASALFDWFHWIREQLADAASRAALDAFASALYAPRMQALGFHHRDGDTIAVSTLRARIAEFLALTVEDAATRKALAEQGRAALGLDGAGKVDLSRADADLRGTALQVAVQDSGGPAFEAALGELKTNHETQQRNELLYALGATRDPVLGERARNFALEPQLQFGEMKTIFAGQTHQPENRAAFWRWFKPHFDRIRAHLPDEAGLIGLVAAGRCSEPERAELSAWFGPRAKELLGAERNLAQGLEGIQQCAALREHLGRADLAAWTAARSH